MSGLNGGAVYIRNAKPNGPAVHTMLATLNMALRWNDDGWEFAASKGIFKGCNYMVSDTGDCWVCKTSRPSRVYGLVE